ncbi:hypothetical protein LOD99_11376 [Oopsacas minuta]|uniref:Uncharacterized protein n=1 Tax=Oopsacas minuta TaxID=111878 RepID=A0AAV7K399_9METZ|nr:hypothetical protein LOD99_11376 [Oopsacas minuta]
MQIALHELGHEITFLTDITMNAFSVLLLNQFAHIKGMQDTIGSKERNIIELYTSLPVIGATFVPALPGSIQIHHDGALHRIASRIDVNRKGGPEDLEVQQVPIRQQQRSSDCRLFAAAVCLFLAQGGDPAKVRWRQKRMRKHLRDCLETRNLTPFRSIPAKFSSNVEPSSFLISLICVCRLPEYAFNKTMACSSCTEKYHNSCLGYKDLRKRPTNFFCFQ